MKKQRPILFLASCLALVPLADVQSAVVFSELNFAAGTITLHNTGVSTVGLDGWRFCSHDTNQNFVYSAPTALNGESIPASGTLEVSFSGINFVSPVDAGNTLSVGLYENSSFGSSAALQAYLQYTPTGNTIFGNAETRTSVATGAGLWGAAGSFIQVDAADTRIVILDVNSATGAGSFDAVPEPASIYLLSMGALGFFMRRRR